MGVPSTHVHETERVPVAHEVRHAPRFELEALGADGVATGRVHFRSEFPRNVPAHGETFGDLANPGSVAIHGFDYGALTRVEGRFSHGAQ